MLRVSLRNLQMHTLRLLLTIAAVTIGVAFISGTFVLSDTMNKAFDELYTGLSGDTDVVVRRGPAPDHAPSAYRRTANRLARAASRVG